MTVGLPDHKGEARVFENTFSYIIDADDLIYENKSYSKQPDMEIYGQFEVSQIIQSRKGAAEQSRCSSIQRD